MYKLAFFMLITNIGTTAAQPQFTPSYHENDPLNNEIAVFVDVKSIKIEGDLIMDGRTSWVFMDEKIHLTKENIFQPYHYRTGVPIADCYNEGGLVIQIDKEKETKKNQRYWHLNSPDRFSITAKIICRGLFQKWKENDLFKKWDNLKIK